MGDKISSQKLDEYKNAGYEHWKEHGSGSFQRDGHTLTVENDTSAIGLADNPKLTKIDGKPV